LQLLRCGIYGWHADQVTMVPLALTLLALLLPALCHGSAAAAAAKKPHLVVILTDDQDMTLGSLTKSETRIS
jgi:hypothetical protein